MPFSKQQIDQMIDAAALRSIPTEPDKAKAESEAEQRVQISRCGPFDFLAAWDKPCISDAAKAFEALLPKHAASLTICHNDHKGVYETVAQTVEDDERDQKTSRYTWRNDAEKQEAIATNEMWYCQWYPDTPIGFCCVAAPTLSKLLAFLAEA